MVKWKTNVYLLLDLYYGSHLGFQNGRHLNYVLSISTYESHRGIKMVGIPMFVIPRISVKESKMTLMWATKNVSIGFHN